jgi:small subunit ribosomal protein S2
MDKELARELISAGVHFGHACSRWNPKMAPYIFGKRGMIHVIDVKETLKGLIVARKLVANIVASGKDVVFVGTKRQAQKSVQRAATACGMHYVSHRWLGGTLTNFRTIRSRVQRLEELETMLADGRIESESKKQGSRLKRELKKITENLNGVRKMNRLPGVVVVVDVRKEYIALREARKLGVVTIGLIDTDADPSTVDVAIPGNDDSLKAIEIILDELALGCQEGKTMVKPEESSPQPHSAKPRSRRRVLASATDAEPAGQEAGASAEPTETQTPQ